MSNDETQGVTPRTRLPAFARHWLGQFGLLVVFASAAMLAMTVIVDTSGRHSNPYVGVLVCLIVPAVLAFGLMLVVLGGLLGPGKPRTAPVQAERQPSRETPSIAAGHTQVN